MHRIERQHRLRRALTAALVAALLVALAPPAHAEPIHCRTPQGG